MSYRGNNMTHARANVIIKIHKIDQISSNKDILKTKITLCISLMYTVLYVLNFWAENMLIYFQVLLLFVEKIYFSLKAVF